jgi:protein SCO1/2
VSRVPVLLALTLSASLAACDPELGVDPGWASAPLPEAGVAVSDSMADVGAELFRRNCAACHSLGGGDVVGPDLSGVTTRRPIEWIRGMVARPDSMLRVDGVAQALLLEYQVPMLNRELDEARVRAILEFLWRADHPPG